MWLVLPVPLLVTSLLLSPTAPRVSSDQVAPASVQDQWHEPDGYRTIVIRAFNAKASDDNDRGTGKFPSKTGGAEGWDGAEYRYRSVSIVQDSSAPLSPPNVMQFSYPAGTYRSSLGGGVVQMQPMHGAYYNDVGGPFPLTEIYFRMAFKISSNWTNNPTGTNKIFFIRGSDRASTEPIIRLKGVSSAPGAQLRLSVDPQGSGMPDGTFYYPNGSEAGSASNIQRGRWYVLEGQFIRGTKGRRDGQFRVWLDGALVMNYGNIEWLKPASPPAQHWDYIHIAPVWGGGGGVIPSTMHLWIDHFYVSGKI